MQRLSVPAVIALILWLTLLPLTVLASDSRTLTILYTGDMSGQLWALEG